MNIEPNEYLKSLTKEVVINCGSNYQLYKLSTLCDVLQSVFNLDKWWNFNGNGTGGFANVANEHIQSQKMFVNLGIFEDGIDCEILDTNFKEWKKGKFRAKLVLEFIPDEPEPSQYESPLDEIRREIEASKLS